VFHNFLEQYFKALVPQCEICSSGLAECGFFWFLSHFLYCKRHIKGNFLLFQFTSLLKLYILLLLLSLAVLWR